MEKLNHLFVLSLFLLFSCSPSDNPETNDETVNFLNDVVDIMEDNSINRDSIDWDYFRSQVLNKATNTQSINDALRLALKLLGDNHSFIQKQNGTNISNSSLSCQPRNIGTVTVPSNIGYIKITSFTGSDQTNIEIHAKNIQNDIRSIDSPDLNGWIVDLRNNGGGNMWPMLAGIGPILGEGIVGYFVGPENSRQPWSYLNGAAILDGSKLVQVPDYYNLINPNPKVSILLNEAVSSSGEAIAIAFINRNNTQSFGSSTCGLSTANSGFQLNDGSVLWLATAYMADRNQKIYGNSIVPDRPTTGENILQDAINYINN